jgi:glycosyltransferase involved in cell wall biosynthesis
MRIDQLTAGFSRGDAISGIAMELQKLFRTWGHDSEIYAMPQFTSPRMRGLCTDYREYPRSCRSEGGTRGLASEEKAPAAMLHEQHARHPSPGEWSPTARDIMVFHFSTGGELIEFFRGLDCRKVLVYHNITPPEYFAAVDTDAAKRLREGYAKLESLRDSVGLAIADSEFNKSGLLAAGYRNVEVVPPLVDLELLDEEPDQDVLRKYSDNFVNVLFVGRVVPNKKFEDLIKIFHFYYRTINPRSRLLLVGSYAGTGRYYSYLMGLVGELDARGVIFTGHVNFRELIAYYRLGDVLLCMSEHEGFCIPLLEAMHFQVPVIAYRSSAVPETLGGASIVVNWKEPELVAEMIHELIANRAFRAEIIRRQNRRLADFSKRAIGQRWRECLTPWLAV